MKTLVTFLALVMLAGLGGCAGQHSLANHDAYYLKSPAQKEMAYLMECPDGSWVQGKVTLQVTQVKWPDSDAGVYTLHLVRKSTLHGKYLTLDTALQYAPREALKKALDPAEAEKAFVRRKMGSVTAEVFVPAEVKTLKLPLELSWNDEQTLTTSLTGSKKYTAQMALVWLNALSQELQLPVNVDSDVVNVKELVNGQLTFDLRAGDPKNKPGIYSCVFAKEQGLVRVDGKLADRTRIELKESR